jgi:hypothetical protein
MSLFIRISVNTGILFLFYPTGSMGSRKKVFDDEEGLFGNI